MDLSLTILTQVLLVDVELRLQFNTKGGGSRDEVAAGNKREGRREEAMVVVFIQSFFNIA